MSSLFVCTLCAFWPMYCLSFFDLRLLITQFSFPGIRVFRSTNYLPCHWGGETFAILHLIFTADSLLLEEVTSPRKREYYSILLTIFSCHVYLISIYVKLLNSLYHCLNYGLMRNRESCNLEAYLLPLLTQAYRNGREFTLIHTFFCSFIMIISKEQ